MLKLRLIECLVRFRALSSDSTMIDQWAMGSNNCWLTIQTVLANLPIEINAVSEKINEQYQRNDEAIGEHLDILIDLLQAYKVRQSKRM